MNTQDWYFDKKSGVYKISPDYKPVYEVLDKGKFDLLLTEFLRLPKSCGFKWSFYNYAEGRKHFDDIAKYMESDCDTIGVFKKI